MTHQSRKICSVFAMVFKFIRIFWGRSCKTPSLKMTVLPGSRRGILDEAKIHKYMHISPNYSVLNIELLQFKCLNSIHQSSYSGIINDKRKLILLIIHRWHHALRHRPQQQSIPMASPSIGYNHQESGPPTGSRPRHHRKGERNYIHIII
jgi:hypothetical protein